MTSSKTYLKFQETRSKEDLDTLNGYLLRLQQISVILNGDTELSNEEENKLYDEDEVDMVLYGATIIQEQEKYKPLIMEKFQYYKDNFDEEEHAEEIDYYLNFLEEPETLYTFTEKTINLFKSFIHEN